MSNFIKEWTHKEVENLTRSIRRYSVFVFILKFILPLAVLAMVGTLFVYPLLSDNGKKILLVAHEVKPTDVKTSPIMTNPKFVGVDSKNQPYQIAAKQAIQQKDNTVSLEGVVADITLVGDKWVSVLSKRGKFNQDANTVDLYEEVNVFLIDPDGSTTQVTAESAFIDIRKGIIKSDSPIHVQSSTLNFNAKNFLLDKAADKITFEGGVKLTIIK